MCICTQESRAARLPAPASQGLLASLLAALHKSSGCACSELGFLAVPAQESLSYYLRYAITSVNSTKQQVVQFTNTVGKTGSHPPGMKLNACV